ncbi:MAG TPA: polymer-forming cytoskeletal protein [Candidatus Acidoferrales bacterium]|nr:polymer-forming cytoskeletal protein [Candidatus Acidoferrales bacterium]
MEIQEVAAESPAQPGSDGEVASGRAGARPFTLGPRDVLEGKLVLEGDLRVQGRAEGEMLVTGDIDVDSGATVRASLQASAVAVRGDVEGTVIARHRLVLAGSATLTGDIQVGRLQIDDGATFNGNVHMGDIG